METRAGRRQFTYSKVMAWAALDCATKDAERFAFEAPLERWRDLREQMHADICAKAFDAARNTLTQSYDNPELDVTALLFPRSTTCRRTIRACGAW